MAKGGSSLPQDLASEIGVEDLYEFLGVNSASTEKEVNEMLIVYYYWIPQLPLLKILIQTIFPSTRSHEATVRKRSSTTLTRTQMILRLLICFKSSPKPTTFLLTQLLRSAPQRATADMYPCHV